MEDQDFLTSSLQLPVPWGHSTAPSSSVVTARKGPAGCDPHLTAPTGAGHCWRWSSPLAGWLLALAALCLAELTPFPLSLAGKNKLFPSLGALDPQPPQPCPHSPQTLQQYLLCRLPGLLITSLGVMESGFP